MIAYPRSTCTFYRLRDVELGVASYNCHRGSTKGRVEGMKSYLYLGGMSNLYQKNFYWVFFCKFVPTYHRSDIHTIIYFLLCEHPIPHLFLDLFLKSMTLYIYNKYLIITIPSPPSPPRPFKPPCAPLPPSPFPSVPDVAFCGFGVTPPLPLPPPLPPVAYVMDVPLILEDIPFPAAP